MMPYDMLTKDMIKQVIAGQKKLLKLSNVKFISAPKYDEISVKNLYNNLLELEGMKKYFPDRYSKGRQCDREYMFNIANTLHPQIIGEIIEHALKQRYNVKEEN